MNDVDLLRARAAQLFPADREKKATMHRLADQWTELLDTLDHMAVGDPAAEAAIEQGFDLLRSITMMVGPLAAFDHGGRVRLHQASLRLTGQGRPPGYTLDRG